MHKLVQYVNNILPLNLGSNLRYCVALSGGVDSIVLLHILSQIKQLHALDVVALHVNHGISPNSNNWQEFCANICYKLDIPFSYKKYSVIQLGGQSLENEARRARYNALLANDSNIIVLAHHQQDQIETILSQIIRGSNIHNFAAMHAVAKKHEKHLWRPLLNISKSQILDYAIEHNLAFISDESNNDTKYLRNFLRNDIIPLLTKQDAHIGNKLVKTIHELQNSARLIDELALIDLNSCMSDDAIIIELFKNLNSNRQVNLLSYYLRSKNLPLPSEKQLLEFARQACTSNWDKTPSLKINKQCNLIKQKSIIFIKE